MEKNNGKYEWEGWKKEMISSSISEGQEPLRARLNWDELEEARKFKWDNCFVKVLRSN